MINDCRHEYILLDKYNGTIFYCCGCDAYLIFKSKITGADNRAAVAVTLPLNNPMLRDYRIKLLDAIKDIPNCADILKRIVNV